MSRPRPSVALYPGSFDPITRGHEDIVRRGLRVADEIIVAVARTSTQSKRGLFSVEERVTLIDEVFGDEDRIQATEFSGLLVDFARKRGAHLVIRGLRATALSTPRPSLAVKYCCLPSPAPIAKVHIRTVAAHWYYSNPRSWPGDSRTRPA